MRLIDADALLDRIANPYEQVAVKSLLEKAPTVGGWISVNDRLPTYADLKAEEVLALFEDGTICSVHFDECIEDESIFGEWRQNFDPDTLGATDSDWIPFEGITHWMPLPEAPHDAP